MSKYAVKPTGNERRFDENEIIVSKTDPKGRLTYVNQVFCKVGLYTPAELMGQPHSIVRHPDMPRCVFKLLWDTLQSGEEVFAYVKNMAKDGSFYWVFANVTPDYDAAGNIIGYLSVRRAPKRSALPVIEGLYKAMLDAETKAGAKDACDASLALLVGVLNEKGLSYEELIHAL